MERGNKTKVKYKLRKKHPVEIRKYTHSITKEEEDPVK